MTDEIGELQNSNKDSSKRRVIKEVVRTVKQISAIYKTQRNLFCASQTPDTYSKWICSSLAP